MTTGGVRLLLLAVRDDRDLPRGDGMDDVGRRGLHVDPLERAGALLVVSPSRVEPAGDALVLRAAQLLGDLVEGHVEGGELVARAGLGPDDGALSDHGQLDDVVLHPTVAMGLMRDLDLKAESARSESGDAGALLFDHGAESIGDPDADTRDVRFHRASRYFR